MSDITQGLRFTVDLSDGLIQRPQRAVLMRGDKNANRIIVTVTDGSEIVDLSGARVTGSFVRQSGLEVPLTGSASGDTVTVALSDHCYVESGHYEAFVRLGTESALRTILLISGEVHKDGDGAIVDVENVIPSIDDILAQLEEMKETTAAANAATQEARDAAGAANTAAGAADTAASDANTARNNANAAAQAASAAAERVDGLTVSAAALDTGHASAAVTERDGHLHIAFGLPKGDTGAIPEITFQAATGAPGTQVQLEQSGPAEAPTVRLTIPRGDTGDIGSLSVNGKRPGPDGAVTIGIGDIAGLQSAIEGAGGVKTVAGVSPDGAGNVPLTAQDVGARPDTWTPTMDEIPGLNEALAAGTMSTQVIITLVNSDGASAAGRTVTITNAEDGSEFERFAYDGQPHTALIPVAARYRVTCGEAQGYITPEPVEYTAVANTPRSITCRYQRATRYGFRREKANSSPTDRITYLYDAEGRTPMSVDLATGAPNYGSWKDFVDAVCRPVMLRSDGTVDYELDHADQTKRLDNGEASDVANAAYDGNAMVEFRRFKWVKRYEDENYEYVIFADARVDDTYHAYAHTNARGEIRDAFYWGMYKGTNVSGKLRSIGTGSIMVSQTRATEIGYAQANGSGTDQTTNGYYTIYKSGWDYIADLLTLVSKSDNSQEAFGSGRCDASGAIAVGSLAATQAFCGYQDGAKDVKVFYVEGAWGNALEGMAGLILDGTKGIKTKMTPPYALDGSGYDATGVVPSGTSGGYVSESACTDAHGYVPKAISGSETTYLCDGLWYDKTVVAYARISGGPGSGGKGGSRCINMSSDVSNKQGTAGSRLTYVPI